jgi:ectoine hydroxylase-related dioxygenase (phytanoyl-CoA dioxygenase family)
VTLPATATATQIKETTDRDGGVIVKDLISADLVARINADLDPYMSVIDPAKISDDPYTQETMGYKTKRMTGLPQISDAVVEAILNEQLLGWADACLSWCGDINLNTAHAIEIGPGEKAQILHRDAGLWTELFAATTEELMVSCMIALTDFTEEVGATRVVPGTTTLPRRPAEEYTLEGDSVPAVMTAGSALFFTGSVVHGGGANVTTDRWRRGLSIAFSLGWLRPEENLVLGTTVERAAQFPPRMRELLGFSAYRAEGFLFGLVGLRDPYNKLFGEERPQPYWVTKKFHS